jgi:excisionase family DNA binding protein
VAVEEVVTTAQDVDGGAAGAPPLLNSIYAVSERTSVCRSTVYKEIRRRRLRAVKIGARTLISERALVDWVTLLEAEAGAARHAR